MGKVRKKYSKSLKFQGVLAMISSEFKVHSGVLHRWKKEFLSKGPDIFEMPDKWDSEEETVGDLQKKIGQLTMEILLLSLLKKWRDN
jgi:hypothetical protein